MHLRISGLLLLALFGAAIGLAQNPEKAPPPSGTWKVILPVLGEAKQASWLIRFEKADAWQGKVVATGEGVPVARIEDVKLDGETLRFTLKTSSITLPAQVKLADTRMVGEVTLQGKPSPILLEATKMTALDDYALAEEALTRPENTRETFQAALTLLALAGPRKATPAQATEWAKRAATVAEGLGAEKRDALLTLATYLTQQRGTASLAVGYAEQAEKLVTESDPPVVRKRILRVLATALERSGRESEAKAVQARNEAIEFLRLKPFTGKARCVVLVENLTCAQQARCLASDLACEGLERTYPAGEVLVLCDHLSLPGPDPLSNPATLDRRRYYQAESTPSVYFNGKPAPAGSGTIDEAQTTYDSYVTALATLLAQPAAGTPKVALTPNQPAVAMPPTLNVKATRSGEKIEVEARVADLATPNAALRLRVALVEEVVDYTGANGLPRHRNVVRDYLGGALGGALLEKASTRSFTVDVADLRKKLQANLDRAHAVDPFPGRTWPTDLKKLRLVAFIQNDQTREILAAVATSVETAE